MTVEDEMEQLSGSGHSSTTPYYSYRPADFDTLQSVTTLFLPLFQAEVYGETSSTIISTFYINLDTELTLTTQDYSWRSEILQIRIRLRFAESKLPSILPLKNAFAKL